MPPPKTKKQKLSHKYGPAVETPNGKIPLGKNSSDLRTFNTVVSTPPAWRVETMPNIIKQPNKANYYGKVFTDPILRRHAWQFMFGGLLRAIFGIYAPSRLWDRSLETKLHGELKDDYEDQKRRGVYGVYCFKTCHYLQGWGKRWLNSQPPPPHKRKERFRVKKGAIFYVRVNRIDSERGWADMEAYYTGSFRNYQIFRVDWRLFAYWLKHKRIRRLSDERIYKLRTCKPDKRKRAH